MCEYDKKHHIDLVEAQILRMSENSKQMKTWCIALVSGVVGIYVQTGNWFLLWIGVAIIVLFAWMDAYYLLIERQFRCVYNDIVGIKNDGEVRQRIPPYGMPRRKYKKGFWKHLAPIISFSIWPIYLAAIIAVGLLLYNNPEKSKSETQKIQLTDSSITIGVSTPIVTQGKDSLWLKTDSPIEANIKIDDTLLVKNFNRCVKYVSIPCTNKD